MLGIYDLSGRCVKTPVNEKREAGYYALCWEPDGLASGIYFVRLEAGRSIATKKITLIK